MTKTHKESSLFINFFQSFRSFFLEEAKLKETQAHVVILLGLGGLGFLRRRGSSSWGSSSWGSSRSGGTATDAKVADNVLYGVPLDQLSKGGAVACSGSVLGGLQDSIKVSGGHVFLLVQDEGGICEGERVVAHGIRKLL